MGVHVPGYSVVMRNSTIERRYPGGSAAFESDCPNQTLASDGVLTKVSFTVCDDAEFFFQRLIAAGLADSSEDAPSKIALTSQDVGVKPPSTWLFVGRADGRAVAWLAGSDRGPVASARPDDPEPQMMQIELPTRYTAAGPASAMKTRAGSNGSREPGVRYNARPFVRVRPARWWQFWNRPICVLDAESYERAFDRGRDIVMAKPEPSGSLLSTRDQRAVEGARELLEQVVAFRPDDWAGQFLLGRAYDLLRDDLGAYARYQRACSLDEDHAHRGLVGRALTQVCLRLGKAQEALCVSRRLLARYPDEPSLKSDHALILLIAGNVVEATSMASEALAADPDSYITRNLVGFIAEVREGRRPRPDRWPPP